VQREVPTDDERHARFEAIYAVLMPRVLGYALRRTDAEEARDVVAETFTVAWRRLDDVPEGEATIPWLLATARKVLANHRRAAESRLRASSAGPRAGLPAHPEDTIGTASLVQAFNDLQDRDREALALVAWDGLAPREAALVAGCSAATFSVRLHRARKRLEALLRDADQPLHLTTEEPA
jgi:RNA polymerase sigma-70 factor (ECF subfamily)